MRFQKNFASRCRRAVVDREVVQLLAREARRARRLGRPCAHSTSRWRSCTATRRCASGGPTSGSGALCMHGTTASYAVDPVGEYVVGMVLAGGMRVRRGREVHRFAPGDVCAWDPSARHEGRPWRSARWQARLVVLELPDVRELVREPEVAGGDVVLGAPRVRDPPPRAALPRAARGARAAGVEARARHAPSGVAVRARGAGRHGAARRRGRRGAIRRCDARASSWRTTSRATSRSPRSPPPSGSAAIA